MPGPLVTVPQIGLELVKVRILGFSNQDTPKRHPDNATPPNVETVAGGAESLSREGPTKSRLFVGRSAAPKVHPKSGQPAKPASPMWLTATINLP